MKTISASLAKPINIFKNTRLKLLKTNVAIWYNKMCKAKWLQPGYINIRSAGKTSRDNKTIQQATVYRINQEIRFLYKKKQYLNRQLYWAHLEGAYTYKGMPPTYWNTLRQQTSVTLPCTSLHSLMMVNIDQNMLESIIL